MTAKKLFFPLAVVFTLLLTAALLLTSPTEVNAEVYSGYCGDNAEPQSISYTLDTETGLLTLTGEGYMNAYLAGNHNTAPWRPYAEQIKTVVLSEGIINVGERAFENCPNLESVILSDTVSNVGDHAFYNCHKLRNVTVGKGLAQIYQGAFQNCSSLCSFTLGEKIKSVGKSAFSECLSLIEIINHSSLALTIGGDKYGGIAKYAKEIHTGESKVKSCGDYAVYTYDSTLYLINYIGNETSVTLPEYFDGKRYAILDGFMKNNDVITDVTVPGTVLSIGREAFAECDALKSVVLGNGITQIADMAFKLSKNLETVTLPEGITQIPFDAFYGDQSLKEIVIPKTVTSIKASAFSGCTALETVVFPEGLTEIGQSSFNSCVKLKAINLPNGVHTIGDYCFQYCGSITEFTAPESLKKLGAFVFAFCRSLSAVNLNAQLTEIGQSAFASCTSLAKIELPEGLTELGGCAFASCTSLTEITIPEGITVIYSALFKKCVNLKSVNIPDGVTAIHQFAFEGCSSLQSISLPDSLTEIYDNAFASCTSLINLRLSQKLKFIDSCAFLGCSKLTTVTVPETLESIGSMAFYGCPTLVEVINHSSLEIKAGDKAHGYVAVNALEVHSGESKIKQYGDFFFYTVDGVNYLITYQGDAEEVSLPESYNGERYVIGSNAFYFLDNLKRITIPAGVSGICHQAFRGCRNLTVAEFANTHDWAYGPALNLINGTPIPPAKLTNTATAAKCLTETYLAEYWYLTAHTHAYNDEIVEPTCTEEGYTLHTCVCGDSYKDSRLPAYGHLFGDDGICTVCGAKKSDPLQQPTAGGCTATGAFAYISYFFTTLIPAAFFFIGKHLIY